eukprot:1121696-Alexandrium_andersonii.AAC.1
MSASLVGSEMCIRDRRRRGREERGQRARGERQRARDEGRRSSPGPSLPVSYTHLTLPTICSV